MRDIAWAAGLFEGEGYIGIGLPRKEYAVWLVIDMTDEDVIFAMQKVCGGYVKGPYGPYGPQKKPYWRWRLTRKMEVKNLLEKMLPYFGERRKTRAKEALEYIEKHPKHWAHKDLKKLED